MSDREIMNAKVGIPEWWKPGIAFLKEEWIKHPYLKQFSKVGCTPKNLCTCSKPKLVELWEHDSCVRGRIDTNVCIKCTNVHSFNIIR
jgi:hypothetical protein